MTVIGTDYPVILGQSIHQRGRRKEPHPDGQNESCIAIFEGDHWRLELMSAVTAVKQPLEAEQPRLATSACGLPRETDQPEFQQNEINRKDGGGPLLRSLAQDDDAFQEQQNGAAVGSDPGVQSHDRDSEVAAAADEEQELERPDFIPEDEWNAMPAHFREFCMC